MKLSGTNISGMVIVQIHNAMSYFTMPLA